MLAQSQIGLAIILDDILRGRHLTKFNVRFVLVNASLDNGRPNPLSWRRSNVHS